MINANNSLVETYRERTETLQERCNQIENISDNEMQQLSAEIEGLLSDLQRDRDILDTTTESYEMRQLVNFETQLTSMRQSFMPLSTASLTPDTDNGSGNNPDDESRWTKSRNRTKEKTTESRERVKENPGRTALGVGTVGLGFLAYRRHKKRKEKKAAEAAATAAAASNNTQTNTPAPAEKKNRRQRNRGWIAGGAGAVGAGYLFRDKLVNIPRIGGGLDKLFNNRMTMEQAVPFVEGQVIGQASEGHLKNHLHLERNEQSKKLSAFGKSFDVDVEKRKIAGLDIQFKSLEDLIATAIIIGSAKRYFRGICATNSPFSLTSLGGDIKVNLATGKETLVRGRGFPWGTAGAGILGAALGGYIGFKMGGLKGMLAGGGGLGAIGAWLGGLFIDNNDTLSKVCPTLNKGNNKQLLISYLNSLGCRLPGNDNRLAEKAETNNDQINQTFVELYEEMQDTIDPNDRHNVDQGMARYASINNYGNHPDIFELKSRNHTTYLKATTDSSGKVLSMEVEDVGIKFTGANAVYEALRLGNFINRSEEKLGGKGRDKGRDKDAFEYKSLVGRRPGIYFDKPRSSWDRVLTKQTIQNKMPTLLGGTNMATFIKWLNGRQDGGSSLWIKTGGRIGRHGRNSAYLNSLN